MGIKKMHDCLECGAMHSMRTRMDKNIYSFTKPYQPHGSFMQHVYFIQNINTKHVKIGTAKHIGRRLYYLQSASADELILIHHIEHGGRGLEFSLHKHFKQYRIRGEWFTADVLDHLDDISQFILPTE